MSLPLRVLHVVPHLDRIGGYEGQARTLARQQHRRQAVAPILLTHAEPGLPNQERGLMGAVHRLDRGLRRFHPGSWWKRHGTDVDVVHAHALHKLTGQVLAHAHQANLPTVVKVATDHDVAMFADTDGWRDLVGDDLDGAVGVRWRLMASAAWKRLRPAGIFVALTDTIERQLLDLGLQTVRVPNGVDTQTYAPVGDDERLAARADLGLDVEGCCIAYVGRLARRKRVAVVVEAFHRLVQRGDESSQLVIAGDGAERSDLMRQVHASGIERRVTFTGQIENVRTVLAAADVSVSPSRREGMPNAVLEAWSSEIATVLSDIPAHRALARDTNDETALFFPVDDATALTARLEDLVRAPERRRGLGRTARELVLAHHTVTHVERSYETLYRDLLARPIDRSSTNARGTA